jgi:hypothetical protein
MMKHAAQLPLMTGARPKKTAIWPRNFFCPEMSMLLALPLLLYSNGKKRGSHRWHLTK